MSDTQVLVEWDNDCDETLAKNCMETLIKAYPSHAWHLNVTGGLIVIKHMRMSSKWGMCLDYQKLNNDAERLRQGVLVAGGELLERGGLIVGVDDGRPVKAVQGIPDKDLVR